MATWKIPVTWEVFGMVIVEAETLKDAMKIARDDDGVIPLPEGEYVDGSWRLTESDEDFVRQSYNNNKKDEEVI